MTSLQICRLALFGTVALLLLALKPVEAHDVRQGTAAFRMGHYGEAAAILMPLAEKGDPIAQFAVAVMHDEGRGLPQNYARALSWYRQAARAGLVDGQYMVGRIYGRGRGVKQNPAAAFYWFNLAAAGGHPLAARLRDQHRNQISAAEARRREAEAVSWQSRHPYQFSCEGRHCIYPRWTARPSWNLLDREDPLR